MHSIRNILHLQQLYAFYTKQFQQDSFSLCTPITLEKSCYQTVFMSFILKADTEAETTETSGRECRAKESNSSNCYSERLWVNSRQLRSGKMQCW